FLNPVDIDGDYLKKCAEYAISHGVKHFEIIGPTHSPIKGNVDGMTLYRKYSQFNSEKDVHYIRYCEKAVNEALDMVSAHGIKSYYWHHELEVPKTFGDVYPEIHNVDGDVEITHPRLKDFLVNKLEDFFHTYPNMSGIVLTLHETRIPLLKLKNQKLGKIERVKYVTQIIYETCNRLGKELIVRPFASIAQDYDDLMDAYEQISKELKVCDKWTKYDWSLTRPHNSFLERIKNPLIIETDIFGEYFGKGFLPLMLKNHITEKVKYCNNFGIEGYVSRIDRGGYTPFGTPNEVNLEIMDAAVDGRDIDAAIDGFFKREYGEYADVVKEAMEGTEEFQIKALHAEGYELHFLSLFPPLFMIKRAYKIFREDFILTPALIEDGFTRFRYDVIMKDKEEAIVETERKLNLIESLKGKLDDEKYYSLYMRFKNFEIVAKIFAQLTTLYYSLARYFEHNDEDALKKAYECIDIMCAMDKEGFDELGEDFYFEALSFKKDSAFRKFGLESDTSAPRDSHVYLLEQTFKKALDMEVAVNRELLARKVTDFIIAGGFSEGHNPKFEGQFSTCLTMPEGSCRTAGSQRGAMWSVVKTHGWFSYEMKVKPGVENVLTVTGKGEDGNLNIDIEINGEMKRYSKSGEGLVDIEHRFTPKEGQDIVTVRIDRNSDSLPFIYTLVMD
ncbi:MAG: hypothetical protein IJN46_00525, partial [Lachnospiraceae bacterium]|nr:hypothetical protein [Lachnospiraceae bacterium]